MEDLQSKLAWAIGGVAMGCAVQRLLSGSTALEDPTKPAGAEQIEVGYWKIRGLAAPLRMMCVYAGVDAKFTQYAVTPKEGGGWDRSGWMDAAKPAIKAKNALANLPFVKGEDGIIVTQSNACLAYLGRRLGLLGSNLKHVSENEQLMCQVLDLRNSAVSVFYNPAAAEKTKSQAHLGGAVKTNYGKFAMWLEQRSSKFLVEDSPLAADFHLFEMIDQHEQYAADTGNSSPLSAFPRLRTYYEDFKSLPQLAGYFAGPLHALPCNNVMAGWGAQ